MLSMATFLPQILKDFYVFKALKCASNVSSKTHYFQTVSILSEFTFHDNIRIVCVIHTSINLQGQSTFQETHCSGKRAAFRWGGRRSGEEGSVQVRRSGSTSHCLDRPWEKIDTYCAFHLCTSGCASYLIFRINILLCKIHIHLQLLN